MSWQRVEVAIPVTWPAPITRLATMAEFETPKRRGGRVFWAEWVPSVRLLVLRATIPVRSNLERADASRAAAEIAIRFWNDGNIALGILMLADDPSKVAGWTWPEGDEP